MIAFGIRETPPPDPDECYRLEATSMKSLLALAVALGCGIVAAPVASADMPVMSDGTMYHRTSYRGAPNLRLTLSLVVAGAARAALTPTSWSAFSAGR